MPVSFNLIDHTYNDWSPKSTEVPVKKNPESSTLNTESKARNPESKTVLDYLTWGDTIISQRDFPLYFVFSFYFQGKYLRPHLQNNELVLSPSFLDVMKHSNLWYLNLHLINGYRNRNGLNTSLITMNVIKRLWNFVSLCLLCFFFRTFVCLFCFSFEFSYQKFAHINVVFIKLIIKVMRRYSKVPAKKVAFKCFVCFLFSWMEEQRV